MKELNYSIAVFVDSTTNVDFRLPIEGVKVSKNPKCSDESGKEKVNMINHPTLFQIGEVARMFHISVGLLRYYEKIGLLIPEAVDEKTGYRYYSVRQFEALNTIQYLRMMGVSLKQIADFLGNRDIGRIQTLLRQQKNVIAHKIKTLKSIEKKIDNRLTTLDDALHSKLNAIRLIREPQRKIAWIRNNVKPKTFLDLENSIRELDRNSESAIVFPGKVGVGISAEHLRRNRFESYDVVFILLDEEDKYSGNIEILPETACVSLRFKGSHKQAAAYYEKLVCFIKDHQLKISGFSREITLIDNGFTSDTSKFVTEIQIPVSA